MAHNRAELRKSSHKKQKTCGVKIKKLFPEITEVELRRMTRILKKIEPTKVNGEW